MEHKDTKADLPRLQDQRVDDDEDGRVRANPDGSAATAINVKPGVRLSSRAA
jgi:hypothetical protein